MQIQITETVVPYDIKDLDAWKDGQKNLDADISQAVGATLKNQARYHFGEFFALR